MLTYIQKKSKKGLKMPKQKSFILTKLRVELALLELNHKVRISNMYDESKSKN
jgi:hypothetical protein